MRILFVAMPDSVHAARWINQVTDRGWDIHLFPAYEAPLHPAFRNITYHSLSSRREPGIDRSVKVESFWPVPCGSGTLSRLARRCVPHILDSSKWLARVIRRVQADMVHSLEFQHASYLTLEARKHFRGAFPPWITMNWGSDVIFFGRLAAHRDRVREVLRQCDYYSCECHRDIAVARQLGFRGQTLSVLPVSAGFDLRAVQSLRSPGPTSRRRLLLFKGYQNWAGRGLVGLRAIELCARELQGYRVVVYTAVPDVCLAAELVAQETGVAIEILPPSSHDTMLRLFGSARVYLGLSIADGICTSLLEAIAMGAFPIQSCTACADEWLTHGATGFIVPPEDPHIVADALRRALTDDNLVDDAAQRNAAVAEERLDWSVIRPQAVAMYERVLRETGRHRRSPFKVGKGPLHAPVLNRDH